MMAIMRDRAQLSSDATAALIAAVLLAVLGRTLPESWSESSPPPSTSNQASFEVTLQPAAESPPAPKTPPPPEPPKMPDHHPLSKQALTAAPAVQASVAPVAVESDLVPDGGALVASSSAPAAAAPPSDARPDLDSQYAAGLRADIDRRTRPPDSVQYRLRRPSGEVRVSFIVTRSGEVGSVRVMRSSGSPILDETASMIVAQGHYPPMPDKAFAGESQHLFAVTIEFRAAS